MASAKDDDSTGIESLVKAFAKDMNEACAKLRKARMDKAKKEADKKNDKKKSDKTSDDPPVVTFALDTSRVTKSRTPAEQAEQVVRGGLNSTVCWGAHMADKAMHVVMKVDGTVNWDPKKTMAEDFVAFKKKWAEAMKSKGLKNFEGGDGWGEGDAFHLELSDSRIAHTDDRVVACLKEYAKLTRKDGKNKNDEFEKKYAKELKKYLDPYEKESKK
jgi:hypothetical protein